MKLNKNDTLVMIGDSITDCGRGRPVGQKGNLGNGYVKEVWALLNAVYPELNLKVKNTGTSGQRVPDLAARWQEDVLDLNPDWVSIMIGINDVWRHFDSNGYTDQVDLETYESTLSDVVEKTVPHVNGMVVMTPYFIEPNTDDAMRAMMDRFSAAAKRVADAHGTLFVDTQMAFDRFLEFQPSQALCGDRVHPNIIGHVVIARALLNTLGFDWNHGS